MVDTETLKVIERAAREAARSYGQKTSENSLFFAMFNFADKLEKEIESVRAG